MTPGETLQRYRRLAGLSQHALAVAVGLTAGAVAQWERGLTSPRPTTARQVDELLDAGGAIMSAFGYSTPAAATPPASADEVEALRVQVAVLVEQVQSLMRDVAAQGVARGRGRRGSGPVTPG